MSPARRLPPGPPSEEEKARARFRTAHKRGVRKWRLESGELVSVLGVKDEPPDPPTIKIADEDRRVHDAVPMHHTKSWSPVE